MTSTPRSTGATPIGNRSGTRPRCYNCGMEARSCPYPRRNKREEEARVQQRSEPAPTTMSALVGEDTIDQLKKRLEKLETKLETKLKQSDCTGVLNTVDAEPGGGDSLLGPNTTAEIYVNSVPTQVLVDTGSPATIASLEFVLEIFFKEGKESQTPLQWREDTEKRFQRPSVLLKAYSGHQLDMMPQVCLKLSHGNQTLEATVLVQDNAPNTLLLGTDLQSKLGFALVADTGTKLTDLLTGTECQTDLSELEEPHAEGSKTLIPSQQEQFAADEPETADPRLGQSELVQIAYNPAEEDSGGGDAQEESLTTCKGTPPVAWANTERVLDPPKEPSYQEALLLTCDRSDSEEIRHIANLDPEIGQHHQERSHSFVLDQQQSTETRTPLVLEPRPMEDHLADRVTCSAEGEVHVVGQVESEKPHIIGCGEIVDVRPCSSSSDSEHNEPRREAGVVCLLRP